MQDVTPPDRSIRNIPVPIGRKRAPAPERARKSEPLVEREDPPIFYSAEEMPRRRSTILWILAALVVAILAGFLISALFEGAKVTVYPKEQDVNLDRTLTAYPDAQNGNLQYQTMRVTRSVTRMVPASGEAEVERRASGKVVITNGYSTASQRLIKNTRFEAPDGKIYRIDESVEVPGGVMGAGNTLTPGTIEVIVFADSPGDSYNKGETTFTVPGFKGDPRYEKFSARTQGTIAGGFIGKEKVVAERDLTQARGEMKDELTKIVEAALVTELPQGYLLIQETAQLAFKDLPRDTGEDGMAIVGLEVAAIAAMVKESDLAAALARTEVEGYTGEPLLFGNKDAVVLGVAGELGELGEDTLTISVSGNSTLVWQFDAESLKAELAGKDRAAFESIIRSYQPEIARAEASIRPFFKNSFPVNHENVDIEVADTSQ